MTGVLYAVRQATLVATARMSNAITAKTLASLPGTVQVKYLHWEHHITKTGHAPNLITTIVVGTDPSS